MTLGNYKGKRILEAGSKGYIRSEHYDKLDAGTHITVKLPDSHPNVKNGLGRYALIRN